jgi:DNA-binding transcriptional ArsR family regulator
MSGGRDQVTTEDQKARVRKLAAALTDPVRSKLLGVLVVDSPLGADDLAVRIGEPEHRVRRHLNALVSAGLVTVAAEESRRGTMKRYFAVKDRRAAWIVTPEEDAMLSDRERRRAALGTLRVIFDEATRAIANPRFGERNDTHILNVSDRVDEQGWHELSELHYETIDRVLGIIAESRERLDADGGKAIGIVSQQVFLETPQTLPDDAC